MSHRIDRHRSIDRTAIEGSNPVRRPAAPDTRLVAGLAIVAATLAALVLTGTVASGHGNVTPQAVDTKDLPKLKGPLTANPYRGSPSQAEATTIGASAFNQNCARCHGLEAISGGIAPDLRHLPKAAEGDEYFQMRIRNGSVRNGVTYMPAFGEIFSEEAIWAIRTYLDSRYEEQ
jgi:cytochrome c-550 PedF